MATRYLLVIAVAWVAMGLVVAFVMRRRGHDFYPWIALGTLLGPLIVPLAIERARFHGVAERESRSIPTSPRRGFDVLVGLDGSEESATALASAVDLFGPFLTSLTIATVLDYDSESAVRGVESRRAAQAMLDRAASTINLDLVQTKILFGRADRALAEYARANGVELIVAGARGRGATEALFGSITSRLVGGCQLPVLVGPRSVGVEYERQIHEAWPALAERLGVTTSSFGTVTLSGLVMVDTAEARFRAVDFSELARNPHYLESSVGDEQLPGREK